jgi:hypothetical protein
MPKTKSQIDWISMQKLFSLLFILFTSAWCSDVPTECMQQNVLAKYTGHYTNPELWDNIPKQRNWVLTSNPSKKGIISANINECGEVGAYDNWHEGGMAPKCSSIIKNNLWIFNEHTHKWNGPLMHVGKASDEGRIYFNRLFQNRCYKDELNQQWCFGNGEIKIDNKKFKASLKTDTVELPSYGSAIEIENGNSIFWMFVPYNEGWKVFQDTWASDENRKEVNPLTDKPWHILR